MSSPSVRACHGRLVLFGTENRVAFMGPLRGALVSHSTAASWLTQTLGLIRNGDHLELVPEVDPNLLEELNESEGVKKLKVQVAKGSAVQTGKPVAAGFASVIIVFALSATSSPFRTLRLEGGDRLEANWITPTAVCLGSAFGSVLCAILAGTGHGLFALAQQRYARSDRNARGCRR